MEVQSHLLLLSLLLGSLFIKLLRVDFNHACSQLSFFPYKDSYLFIFDLFIHFFILLVFQNPYGFINQCLPNKFNLKNKVKLRYIF